MSQMRVYRLRDTRGLLHGEARSRALIWASACSVSCSVSPLQPRTQAWATPNLRPEASKHLGLGSACLPQFPNSLGSLGAAQSKQGRHTAQHICLVLEQIPTPNQHFPG